MSAAVAELDPYRIGRARSAHAVDRTATGHEGAAHGAIRGYAIGLAPSTLLTAASFYVLGTRLIWAPAIPVALVVLAIAQIGVHLVFFLHITTAPDNTNNALIIAGSLWIMDHLNHNMLTMEQVMRMQRWRAGTPFAALVSMIWRAYLFATALLATPALAGTALSDSHPEEAIPNSLPPLHSPGPNADLIRQVQEKLHALGFDAGPVNGNFGTKTQAALAQYQLSQTLPASGMLDDKTLRELAVNNNAPTE